MSHDNQRPPPASYRAMQRFMAPLLKRLGMSCRDITELSAAKIDRRLTRGEALKLKLHTMVCDLCRRLPRQFDNLQKLVRCAHPDEPPEIAEEQGLTPAARERIDRCLRNHRNK